MEINLTDVKTIREGATYEVPVFKVGTEGLEKVDVAKILLVKGSKNDSEVFSQEGFTPETLLSVCLHYLQDVNKGELANRDTSIAITHIEDALLRLQKRAADRKARLVQNTYQK